MESWKNRNERLVVGSLEIDQRTMQLHLFLFVHLASERNNSNSQGQCWVSVWRGCWLRVSSKGRGRRMKSGTETLLRHRLSHCLPSPIIPLPLSFSTFSIFRWEGGRFSTHKMSSPFLRKITVRKQLVENNCSTQ